MHAFLATLMILAGAPLPAPPTGQDLARAEADVREVFGKELSAVSRQPSAKLKADGRKLMAALARKMIETAAGSRPAAKYALLVRARELAIAAGDSGVGIQAVEGLAGFAGPAEASEGHRLWAEGKDLKTRLAAAEVYLRALPGLDEGGFERAAVEKRLRELGWGMCSPEEVRRLFGMGPERWRIEKGCLIGRVEDLGKSRLLLLEPIRADRVEFCVSMNSPRSHYISAEVDGRLCAYLRGGWGNRGSSTIDQFNEVNRKQLPGPIVQRAGEFHQLRLVVGDRRLHFYYDGERVYEAPIPPPPPGGYSIRLGFSSERTDLLVRDISIER